MAYDPSRGGGDASGVPGRAAVHYLEAGEGDEGQRLDNFLVRVLKGVPRSHVYRLLRRGEVRVNSKRARPDQRLAIGDRVRVPPVRAPEPAGTRPPAQGLRQAVAAAIVHEDADVLVVNKPAGIAAHGGSGLAHGVIEALRADRPDATELDLVHRLDRETSGCLVVAKRRAALRDLHAQFREGRTEKRYLALLCGHWNLGRKTVELPIATGERRGGERHVAVRPHGERAVTTFRPVQFFGNVATLVEVELGTGKTHQIRVHAAYAGHPVAGDDKYGDREQNARLRELGLGRMFLHAVSIGFTRPGSHEPCSVSAPLDPELAAFVDVLAAATARRRSARSRVSPDAKGARPRGAARR